MYILYKCIVIYFLIHRKAVELHYIQMLQQLKLRTFHILTILFDDLENTAVA